MFFAFDLEARFEEVDDILFGRGKDEHKKYDSDFGKGAVEEGCLDGLTGHCGGYVTLSTGSMSEEGEWVQFREANGDRRSQVLSSPGLLQSSNRFWTLKFSVGV